MTTKFGRSQRLMLLLNEFNHARLHQFIINIAPDSCDIEFQDTINKPKSSSSYNRWINNGEKSSHSLFQLPSIYEYLSDNTFDKKEIVSKAHSLLTEYFPSINPKFRSRSTIHLLTLKYESLLLKESSEEENQYAAIENMGEEFLPYYKDRLLPDFLNLHLEALKRFIGNEAYERILSKILVVKHPENDQRLRYPVLDLADASSSFILCKKLALMNSQEPPETFLAAVRKSIPGIFNGATFALQSFSPDTGEIECGISNYFKALYFCDKHFYNIVGGYPGLTSDKLADYINSIELESWALELKKLAADNDFSHGEYSLGSSCLFIYNTKEYGYQTLLAKKAPRANSFNDTHVIPASMFQPVLNNPYNYESELDFKDQVIREVAEEIFGYPEQTGSHAKNYLFELYSYPEIAHLEALFNSKQAEFHVTGLCLDLFRLRPEVLSTIIVHDTRWAEEQFPAYRKLGNWETIQNGIVPFNLNEDTFFDVCASNRFNPLCAPGIAAFVHGFRKFSAVLKARDKKAAIAD